MFKHGPNTARILGSREKLPVVTTAVKAVIRRIYHKFGRELKDEPSEEGHTVQRVLSPLQTLPDDVLLEIFNCHRQVTMEYVPWKWHRLAQVCRRWRSVVFAHPRHLDLRIVLTYNKTIRNAPKFWPVLPIIIWYPHPETGFHPILTPSDEDNISHILENPARICEIDLGSTLPLFTSSLEVSFPALDHLRLRARSGGGSVVLPSTNFLDGSAPRLRVLHLRCTAIPMLSRLLSSSKNLISLRLEDIKCDRYFPAEDLVIGLSAATQLKFLELSFHPVTASAIFSPMPGDPSPLSSRFVLPSLTEFRYGGESAYLRYFVSKIETPIIERICVSFFYEPEYDDNHELCELFGLEDVLRSSRCRATHIRIMTGLVAFSHHFSRSPSSPGLFRLQFPYRNRRPFLPLLSQVYLGLESQDVLNKVIQLEIEDYPYRLRWQQDERDPACWLDLLRALTGLKMILVSGRLASTIASALAQVTGETIREILPALQELHFGLDSETPSSIPASIGPFITERQLCGLPVSVQLRKLSRIEGRWGELMESGISY